MTIPLFLYFSSKFWAPLIKGGSGDSPADALLWGRVAFWLAAGVIINISILRKVIIGILNHNDFPISLYMVRMYSYFLLSLDV